MMELEKPVITWESSAFGLLTHCALYREHSWGNRRCVWCAFDNHGKMITWSASKRHCQRDAERTNSRFIMAKISGIHEMSGRAT